MKVVPYQQIGEHDFKKPLGSFQLFDREELPPITIALLFFIFLVVPAL